MTVEHIYDLAIVGCGPAGLSAAINAKIRKLDFVIFGSEFCSPKLHQSPIVDNYLGFFNIRGEDLRQHFLNHVRDMGIVITHNKITNIFPDGDCYVLLGKDTTVYKARAVILATGVAYGKQLPGEDKFVGRGVSYCGTCDGPLYKGREIAVVGYTKEAEEEVEYLSTVAGKVHYFVQYDRKGSSLPDNVVISTAKVIAIEGDQQVQSVITGEGPVKVDAVFIFRDAAPAGQMVLGLETRDGVVIVDRNLQTNLPGVFAAGDITGKPWQLAKAVGEGSTAALNAASYIRAVKKGQVEPAAVW